MFGNSDPKKVDIELLENVAIDGVHYPAKGEDGKATVLKGVDGALAMEMAAQGKCKLATAADKKAK